MVLYGFGTGGNGHGVASVGRIHMSKSLEDIHAQGGRSSSAFPSRGAVIISALVTSCNQIFLQSLALKPPALAQ